MGIDPQKTRKVTIQDVLDEHELELMGLRESVDGIPNDTDLKVSEFLHNRGVYVSSGYIEIHQQ